MKKPNIVYILADDLGYGDISVNNPGSKINTSHIDTVAEAGIRFTEAHSSSAVCTPTRYSILTGRYCWRTMLKQGVVGGYCPHLIDPERTTVASFLKAQGYDTACIGKWHLGMDWVKKGDEYWSVDFGQAISNGPNSVGFDYYYGISASLDMPPYAYIENDRVTEIPDQLSKNDDSKEFWREGMCAPGFSHIEVLPHITEKACKFIQEHENADRPYFLYFPLPAPHGPILPLEQFVGKSNTNSYGDFVLQVDAVVGQIVQTLKDTNQFENTIVVFTSDNGCSPVADFEELKEAGHHPSYHFRGHKADIFEGGHHVPLVMSWPEGIKANSLSHEIVCLSDLLATCAGILDVTLPDNAGEDSFDLSPIFRGESENIRTRSSVITHSVNGSFAIQRGRWKLEMCPDSGGWSDPRPGCEESDTLPAIQLYDLEQDVGERNNIYTDHPDVVLSLRNELTEIIRRGRSTSGSKQANDGEVWWEQLNWIEADQSQMPKQGWGATVVKGCF
ncbi:arylsulfatase [Rubellicoccus peritrichatus]|uniref:Arylsulfatase n=1 Tax=Rubellicoccus peritrichatus TaxID=3080537 RepID=A0AAQ3L815_9BACT|nr:arylsulfatase [Puniceicoccus sp. CR14]WOO39609.1 arylsulfatase [Puniceicoccus sp. CR14]